MGCNASSHNAKAPGGELARELAAMRQELANMRQELTAQQQAGDSERAALSEELAAVRRELSTPRLAAEDVAEHSARRAEVPAAGPPVAIEGDESNTCTVHSTCCWTAMGKKVEAGAADAPAAALQQGVAVEAQWTNGVWYHGTVSRVHADGSVNVALNIDEHVEQLPPSQVRVNQAFEQRKAQTEDAWQKYQALDTDDERIAFCEELNNTPVLPDDYEQATGRLALLIRIGAISLLKGSWLVSRAEQGLPIDRRQDMPSDAYWLPQELLQSWARSKGRDRQPTNTGRGGLCELSLVLIALSVCWCSQGHPDQDMYHLRRVKMLLEAFAKFRQQKGSPWKDIAVFWDFSSIYQSPRTPLEDALFDLAKGGMQLVYGHDLAFVWKLTAMPPCPQPLDADRHFEPEVRGESRRLAWLYHDRGWPSFESAAADARLAVAGSRMSFGNEELTTLQNYGETLRFRSNGTAIHPERFARVLATKTFANSSDAGKVTQLYQRTFDMVKRTKSQIFQGMDWNEERTTAYFEALAEMQDLEEFSLASSALGDAAALRFAQQLTGKRLLKVLGLVDVGLTDAAVGPLLVSLPAGLRTLELREDRLSLEGIPQEARMPVNLEKLALQGNRVTDRGATQLAGMLPASLEVLLLDNNAIGDGGVQALFASLPANLQILELVGNRIALEAMQEHTRMPVNMVQLNLRNNRIGDRGAAWLAGKLPPGLTTLLLDNNLIEDIGAEALLASLPANTQVLQLNNNRIALEAMQGLTRLPVGIVQLTLKNNRIGDQGAVWLAGRLPAGLVKLFLDNNLIEDIGAEALLAGLPAGLRELQLDGNRVALEAVARLPEGLEYLSLTGNRLDDRGTASLGGNLPKSIQRLLLGGNSIGDAGAEAMAETIGALPELRYLNLHGNAAMTEEGRRVLKAALPRARLVF